MVRTTTSAAMVTAARRALWICRCAWTTLTRRPQLHRPTSVSIDLLNGRGATARPQDREATGTCLVRQRMTSRGHSQKTAYDILGKLLRLLFGHQRETVGRRTPCESLEQIFTNSACSP